MYLEAMLVHYNGRIGQAFQTMEEGKERISSLNQMVEETWKGKAAESLSAKLMICEEHRKRVEEELSMAIYYMKQMTSELEELEEFYEY